MRSEQSETGGGVEVEVTGEVWYWRGPSPYHYVTVPPRQSDELRALGELVTYGWGMVPVDVEVGATRFTTSLFPKDGGYVVPLKDAVRAAEGIGLGDEVTLRISVRERR